MKLSVCIDALYRGMQPPADRGEAIDRVLDAGITAVEFWGWEEADILALEKYRAEKEIQVAAFCTKFISLTDASLRVQYIEGLRQSIAAAKRLHCNCLITQTGADLGTDRAKQKQSLIDGLRACAPLLEQSGITLLVEPLNVLVDHPGYFLTSSAEAAEIIVEVGSPNIKMLFDIYHQQITEGDLIRRIREYLPLIGHFHAAGNPGRHELYDSEVNYQKVIEVIRQEGYEGFLGLEYFPLEPPEKGLAYAKEIMNIL